MTLPKKFEINFTDNLTLVYNLIEHTVAEQWATLIQSCTIDDCCLLNHYIGNPNNKKLINSRIQRLYQLADIINSNVPDQVVKIEMNESNWSHALQLMHVHFPHLVNDRNYQHLWGFLTEYNDLIHWLESCLANFWTTSDDKPVTSSGFRIGLDFNKSTSSRIPIPEEGYKLFTSYFVFGDLMIHYCHVGRHAQELLVTNDFECPKDQFVPQREFNASTRMHFFNFISHTEEKKMEYMQRWKNFYEAKGGFDYFGIDIDDPKIAFGYMKIGQLESISDRPLPTNLSEINEFRDKLVNTQIINWNIKGA
jgi:hypothetical protein